MTNLSVWERGKSLEKVNGNYSKTAIIFKTPIKEIIKRNKKRIGKKIPIRIIRKMYIGYESPTIEEGFNKILLADNS